MPAAIPIAIAVMAATQVYQGVEANQERQHAKGAAEAEATKMNASLTDAIKQKSDFDKKSADTAARNAGAAQSSASARQRAIASGSSGLDSTILTSPLGAPPGDTAGKTLLGA